MKAHAQRTARLQLIANMLAGQPWQQAMTNAGLQVGRATAYRRIVEYCTQHPGVYSSQVQAELRDQFGLEVSRGHINRVRAETGVTAPWRGRAKKN